MLGTVTVEWWYRWQALEEARQARQAWQHYQRSEKPGEELSEDEQAAISGTLPTQEEFNG